jgi:hypothetical protein
MLYKLIAEAKERKWLTQASPCVAAANNVWGSMQSAVSRNVCFDCRRAAPTYRPARLCASTRDHFETPRTAANFNHAVKFTPKISIH